MVTPASLYILRSALNLSIDTDVRHAFSFSAASRCAACCSGEASPRPRPPAVPSPRPRPPPAPPPRAAAGASPRGAALQGCPAHDALNCGGGAAAAPAPRRPPRAPPPPAPPPRPEVGAPAKLSTGPPINSIALMPESTTYLSVASAL